MIFLSFELIASSYQVCQRCGGILKILPDFLGLSAKELNEFRELWLTTIVSVFSLFFRLVCGDTAGPQTHIHATFLCAWVAFVPFSWIPSLHPVPVSLRCAPLLTPSYVAGHQQHARLCKCSQCIFSLSGVVVRVLTRIEPPAFLAAWHLCD
jgi:hypothetical protein